MGYTYKRTARYPRSYTRIRALCYIHLRDTTGASHIQKTYRKMNKLLKIAKIIILTIVTFGLYGAYWIFINLMENPAESDPDEPDNPARKAQDTIALTWLHFINR